MIDTFQLFVHEILSLALMWSAFCRSALASESTKPCVRFALLSMGAVGAVAVVAPLYGWSPDWVTISILAGFVINQVVNAQLWRFGVPDAFQR